MNTIKTYAPYKELLEDFRQKMFFLKTEHHLEQREIAEKICVHPTNISRYMNGQGPSLKKLIQITNALNRSYTQQLNGLMTGIELNLSGDISEEGQIEQIAQALLKIEADIQSLRQLISNFIFRSVEK